MLVHCFWVFGFKPWFEFEFVCCLIWFGERIWNEKEKGKKRRRSKTAAA
jgi:hypothetical protein